MDEQQSPEQRNSLVRIVAFIVNGGHESAMGYRARSLAMHLKERIDIRIVYRESNRLAALISIVSFLRRTKPQVSYVFDMSYSGVIAGWFYRLWALNCLVIETGDAIYELARSTGSRGPLLLFLTRCLEWFALHTANGIVVRGTFHKRILEERGIQASIIQDGVEVVEFASVDSDELRKQHGLNGVTTVGMIGTSQWSDKLGTCYGWDLIDAIRQLKDEPVKGVMIGNGSGIDRLKERCREYGIENKVIFMGYVPYKDLPSHLGLIDVCLSTQTNNVVGQVRTTGKLPLYLAAGRFILASDVGEASLVLDRDMLVEYRGVVDHDYPNKLVGRIRDILAQPEILRHSAERNVEIARTHFDYSVLADRLGEIIEATCKQA